ncbi:MAG: ABC transporter permease, partial [Gemmatimonadetes bacterium]|nr:ABC transporter permease [Gemmatimonadota bacterium]
SHDAAILWSSPEGLAQSRMLFVQAVALFLPLGAFLATAHVLSGDRDRGYVRFYFSKPLSATRFYLQQYLVHGAAFVALFGLATVIWGAVTTHQSVHRAMEAAALTWLLVGGLGFFLGAALKPDGAVLAVVYLLASLTQGYVTVMRGAAVVWMRGIAAVTPPVLELDALRTSLYAGGPLDAHALAHVAGYGALTWVLGVVALQRLPLQR